MQAMNVLEVLSDKKKKEDRRPSFIDLVMNAVSSAVRNVHVEK